MLIRWTFVTQYFFCSVNLTWSCCSVLSEQFFPQRKDKMRILTLHGDSCTLQTFAGFLRPRLAQRLGLDRVEEPFAAVELCSALVPAGAVRTVKGGNHQWLSGKVAQSLQSQSTPTGYFGTRWNLWAECRGLKFKSY